MKTVHDCKTFTELKLLVGCPHCWYTVDFTGNVDGFPEICNYTYRDVVCKRTRQEVDEIIQIYNKILS